MSIDAYICLHAQTNTFIYVYLVVGIGIAYILGPKYTDTYICKCDMKMTDV